VDKWHWFLTPDAADFGFVEYEQEWKSVALLLLGWIGVTGSAYVGVRRAVGGGVLRHDDIESGHAGEEEGSEREESEEGTGSGSEEDGEKVSEVEKEEDDDDDDEEGAWWGKMGHVVRLGLLMVVHFVFEYSYLLALLSLYVSGLESINILNGGFLLFFVVFLLNRNIAHQYWMFLLIYVCLVIVLNSIWGLKNVHVRSSGGEWVSVVVFLFVYVQWEVNKVCHRGVTFKKEVVPGDGEVGSGGEQEEEGRGGKKEEGKQASKMKWVLGCLARVFVFFSEFIFICVFILPLVLVCGFVHFPHHLPVSFTSIVYCILFSLSCMATSERKKKYISLTASIFTGVHFIALYIWQFPFWKSIRSHVFQVWIKSHLKIELKFEDLGLVDLREGGGAFSTALGLFPVVVCFVCFILIRYGVRFFEKPSGGWPRKEPKRDVGWNVWVRYSPFVLVGVLLVPISTMGFYDPVNSLWESGVIEIGFVGFSLFPLVFDTFSFGGEKKAGGSAGVFSVYGVFLFLVWFHIVVSLSALVLFSMPWTLPFKENMDISEKKDVLGFLFTLVLGHGGQKSPVLLLFCLVFVGFGLKWVVDGEKKLREWKREGERGGGEERYCLI